MKKCYLLKKDYEKGRTSYCPYVFTSKKFANKVLNDLNKTEENSGEKERWTILELTLDEFELSNDVK